MDPDLIKLLQSGFVAQQRGALDEALQLYRKVLEQDPRNQFALNLTGVVLVRQSNFPAAAESLERAIAINAGDPETFNNLGLAYKGLKRFRAAERAFRQSLRLSPDQPAVHNNLGNVLAAIDRHSEAVSCFQAALRLDPGYTDCMHNLAVSLKELGQSETALEMIRRAINAEPSRGRFNNTLGEILLREARYEQALESFETAIRIEGCAKARVNLSTALKQLGRTDTAVRVLEDVIAEEPHNAEAHHHLGVLLEQLGDTRGSAAEHRLALASDRRYTSSYYQIAKLKDDRLTAAELENVRNLLDDETLLDTLKSSLYFALACEHEKEQDYQSSIECFSRAQAIRARRNPYDPAPERQYLAVSRETFPFDPPAVEQIPGDPIPVFVIGMPRSGTTLTEQILTSHSEIEGAGEVAFVKELATRAADLTQTPFPACAKAMTDDVVAVLRRKYFARMSERCGQSAYVVDKNPLNFNFTGFIATLFPEARFLYCKRDPIDNCLSIFRLPFDDNQGYSHDLVALGRHYRQHEQLMNFWMRCYGDQILTVRYEDTVNDLEKQARRLFRFLGTGFEEGALRFFENRRPVMTPSAEQVRQPIYTTSVNAWRRYGKALEPLIDALGIDDASQSASRPGDGGFEAT